VQSQWAAVTVHVAFVGTELAPLRESSGALERVALGWAEDLRLAGLEVSLVDAGPDGPLVGALEELGADVVVLNNRPLWAGQMTLPVVQVLHNYPDAWGTDPRDPGRVARALAGSAVAAVSPTLARDVEDAYEVRAGVGVVRGEVEECFFGAEPWHGEGGPVVFPNRLLEKKGVRFFLDLSRRLAWDGLRCVLFRHLAPWSRPTAEHAGLLEAIARCESVELLDPPETRSEMASWYARAGVVVCPSVVPEGIGMVALEAQAAGAPVVTSGRGGLADSTFPPNEVVADLEVEAWRAAVHRATARAGRSGPAEAVARAHGRGAATASLLSLLERAIASR
jgi:glycosyltransferase involved in cell wall biosynthesis